MTTPLRRLASGVLVLLALGIVLRGPRLLPPRPVTGTLVGRRPALRPDYDGVTVPPNLAPLNFVVGEPGREFCVMVRGAAGSPLTVRSRTAKICFPRRPWRRLLAANRGERLTVRLAARQPGGGWQEFAPLTVRVAEEEIDPYLTYRLITPIYSLYSRVSIHQRDLRGATDRLVCHGRYFARGCVNCHSFAGYRTGTMSLGVRGDVYGNGTLLVQGGGARKLDAVWCCSSWHPSGRLAAYSMNRVRQFFHAAQPEQKDVIDLDSDVVVYTVGSHVVTTAPALADPRRLETYPAWSPDGRYLYFCSAPLLWKPGESGISPRYREVRYDLRRVAYDARTGTWGAAETVLSAAATGRSILLPRVSPDGRFLLFCMCDYGCFPIYQPSSDLYLMDLASRRYRRLELSSDRSESWHCWSSNGRWIAFSSKREDGLFTRTYLSHVDASGAVSGPLVLPQEDPTLYDRQVQTYTVPEFTREPVRVARRALSVAARTRGAKLQMPDISMTRKRPAAESPYSGAPAH